jgi:hypothetical protein
MGNSMTVRIPVKDRDGRIIDEKEVATYQGLLSRAHEEGLSSVTTRLVQVPGADNGDTAIVEATVTTSKGTFGGIGDANPGNVNRKVAAHVIRMAETRAKARALRDAVNIGVVALEELGGDEDEPRHRQDRRDERPPREVPRNDGDPREARQQRPPGDRRDLRVGPVGGHPGQDRDHPAAARDAPPANDQRGFAPRRDEAPRRDDPRRDPAPESRRDPPRNDGGGPGMTENQRRYLYRFLSERGFEGQAATDALCEAAEVRDVGQISKAVASELIDAWKKDAEDQRGGGRAA